MKIALITGITGQDGAYLSKLLIEKGYKVFGTSRNDKPDKSKLLDLKVDRDVTVITCDLNKIENIEKILEDIKPTEIYNLAGQSSVDYSFENPALTIHDNIIPTLNLLESIRKNNLNIRLFNASSSEMYGHNTKMPITEETAISPLNPYGISKAASYMLVKNYRESYGLNCVSGITFNHESKLRSSKFFIRRLIRTSINISNGKDLNIYLGQLNNKRDFGYTPEYTKAMWMMLQSPILNDYVICSGKPLSIKEITEYVLSKFNIDKNKIKIDEKLFRLPNVEEIYGDNSKIKKDLNWKYNMSFYEVLDILIDEELKDYK